MTTNIAILILLFTSSLVLASGKSFVVDFADAKTYVAALNKIRDELGTALQNIPPLNVAARRRRT